MAVVIGNQAPTSEDACRLALAKANLEGMDPAIPNIFFPLVDPEALHLGSRNAISAALREKFGRRVEWNGSWQYVPIPRLEYEGQEMPRLIVNVQVYALAPVVATLPSHRSRRMVTVVVPTGKPITLILPLLWFYDLLMGQRTAYQVIQKQGQWTTLRISGSSGDARLHDGVTREIAEALQRQSLYRWLSSFGDRGIELAPLLAGWLLGWLVGARGRSTGSEPWRRGDLEELLSSLGFSTKEVESIKVQRGDRLKEARNLDEAVRIALERDS
ncbi:MAG: hypothetical protein HY672_01460 [Chloroflexi bacterium]|nr:hypothetical protein [Chloroflexota bacterium]